jgi:hypothetical protein
MGEAGVFLIQFAGGLAAQRGERGARNARLAFASEMTAPVAFLRLRQYAVY